MKDKSSIRKQALQIRSQITAANKQNWSQQIFESLCARPAFDGAQVVFVYASYNNEVDTKMIIKYALACGKRVCVPLVVDNDTMKAAEIFINDKFDKNKYGILEPACARFVEKNQINLAIVPGAAFDSQLNRIGYGKGYYDNFLRGQKIYKIALAFDCQVCADTTLPVSNIDVKMDEILTPTRIILPCV